MAVSNALMVQAGQAHWSEMTVRNSVANGYKISGWVYRAISLIVRAASSVPMVVFNPDGEAEPEHPLSLVLEYPSPQFSRQDSAELLTAWLQLAGNGFIKRVVSGGRTVELWPISPDRLAPIPSKNPGLLVDGYEYTDENGARKRSEEYTTDNVVHFKLLDPSKPYLGIGPLQAAAKAVDLDNEQQNWNKSAMQNRGVFDGVFTFKDYLDGTQFDMIREKIKEKWSGADNARTPGVLGADAKYQRMSVTPAELDFINSRKMNRDDRYLQERIVCQSVMKSSKK